MGDPVASSSPRGLPARDPGPLPVLTPMTLGELNRWQSANAEAEFLKCCGSQRWASAMTAARPFANIDELLTKADRTWSSLRPEDWLEAFRAHPRIGEKKAAAAQSKEAQQWSAQEQSG